MKKLMIIFLITTLSLSIFPVTIAASGGQLILINKATNELAFYENSELVRVFSVGTGRSSELTPEGSFKIVNKIVDRPYYKENIAGGDPNNPLGNRWLGINARGTWGTTYAIHGNNNPDSIGHYVSAGCIRMHNDEVKWLFDRVKIDTPVIITTSSDSFEQIAKSHGYSVSSGSDSKEKAPAPPPLDCSALQEGCKGENVRELQKKLEKLGYSVGGPDGDFGPATHEAVTRFQKDYNLTVDGLVGANTLKAMDNAIQEMQKAKEKKAAKKEEKVEEQSEVELESGGSSADDLDKGGNEFDDSSDEEDSNLDNDLGYYRIIMEDTIIYTTSADTYNYYKNHDDLSMNSVQPSQQVKVALKY